MREGDFTLLISLIVPCYNEEASLPILYEALCDVRRADDSDRNYEFIFVNDGSRDKTAEIIRSFAENDKSVKYVFFSYLMLTCRIPRPLSHR